jgi:cytolysin-activating lysine-acyltransferase
MYKFNPNHEYTVWVPCLEDNPIVEPVNILGIASWLWMNSQLHSNWTIRMLSVNIIPAIQLNQFSILFQNNIPFAFCSWAYLDDAAEVKYIKNSNSLQKEDWNSGDNVWFIDGLSPFGGIKNLTYYLRGISIFNNRVGYIKNVRAGNYELSKIKKVIGKNVDRLTIQKEDERFLKNIKDILHE